MFSLLNSYSFKFVQDNEVSTLQQCWVQFQLKLYKYFEFVLFLYVLSDAGKPDAA